MNKLPTAESSKWEIDSYIEELIKNNCKEIPYEGTEINKTELKQDIMEFLLNHRIEFAKLHCKRQAEVIAEKAKTTGGNMLMFGALHVRVDKDSILNAYNLEEEIK